MFSLHRTVAWVYACVLYSSVSICFYSVLYLLWLPSVTVWLLWDYMSESPLRLLVQFSSFSFGVDMHCCWCEQHTPPDPSCCAPAASFGWPPYGTHTGRYTVPAPVMVPDAVLPRGQDFGGRWLLVAAPGNSSTRVEAVAPHVITESSQ